MIEVKHISKEFISAKKYPGFKGAVKGLFNREKVKKVAVDDISFIMNEKPNTGLSLGINGAGFNAQRWVLNGPAAERPMRIEITYSIVQD